MFTNLETPNRANIRFTYDKSYPRGNFKWNQLDNGSISISLLTQFCESELKLSTNLDNNRSFPRNNKKLR